MYFLLVAAIMSTSCADAPRGPAKALVAAVGDSKQSAIEVCMPAGERAYLARLVCANGEPASSKRIGSFGSRNEFPKGLSAEQERALIERVMHGAPLRAGDVDYHVIDGYEVSCGEVKRRVFMDMYHCDQPPAAVAPEGFGLRSAPPP